VRRGLGGIALAVAVLAVFPFVRESLGLTGFYVVILYTIFFWTAQATSWNLLSGYAGYFSFGQGAFVGVGAYTAAVLAGRHGVDYFVTIPLAGALSVVLALVVGALAFRLRSLRGEIFALLTLAVPLILASVARLNTTIDGGQGIIVPAPEFPDVLGAFQDFLYLFNLAIAALAVAIAYAIQHSRFGWALIAIRDSEDVAEGLGVPTFRYKMFAIAASGLIGGISGAAFAQQIGFVNVQAVFGLTIPLFVIVMSVLGGRTHWLGPVIGATFIVLVQDRLVVAGLEKWRLIIFGAVLAFVVVAAPEGLQARLRARPAVSLGAFVLLAVGSVLVGVSDELLDAVGVGAVGAAAVALWPGSRRPVSRRPVSLWPVSVDASLQPAAAGEPAVHVEPGGAVADSPATAAPLVECIGLSRSFGGVHALDDLTLTISEGELVGLVGPNGSGKTTLVNLLSGTLRPTRGRIRIVGNDTAGLAPHRVARSGVARTYQIPRPFPSMTVRDNVAMAIMFGRDPRPLAAARLGAQEHLDFVHLTHLADVYPHEINLHERQLLEMARAIASNPRVLLLDEALAGLNPTEIDSAVAVIRRIHHADITIVIVEHLLRVVNQLATRVVVLDRGHRLADGDPRTVMSEPAVVTAYLGRQAGA
jgi:branched-chain amino acid transport system permease protein